MIGKTNATMMGTDTSDATALASDIALNKIAYGAEGIPLTGTLEHLDTSDATATADNLGYGKTAYADGTKLVGEGAGWQYVKTITDLFSGGSLPAYFEFYAPSASGTAYRCFQNNVNLEHIKINLSNQITSYFNFFAACSKLKIVESELDASNVTSFQNIFYMCPLVEEVRFVRDTIKVAAPFNYSSRLSDASLLSIANGLNAAAAPQTLTMQATSKTNMNSITVDNNAGLAVIGTAMTLTAFITSVKGWTIA